MGLRTGVIDLRYVMKGEGLKGLTTGTAEGEAIVCREPISFLGGVDPSTGVGIQPGHPLEGRSVAGKVLVFPTGAGSTVGSYVLVNLKRNGFAPIAIINRETDVVVLVGAVLANIPLVHRFKNDPLEMISDGMLVSVDAEAGTIIIDLEDEPG